MAPLIIGGTAYSNYLTSTYGKPANIAAGVIQAISWILQFVGHGALEEVDESEAEERNKELWNFPSEKRGSEIRPKVSEKL